MKLKNRVLSLIMSVVMLLSPAMALAEAPAANYYAGELTKTAIADSYYGGSQLDLNVAFGVDTQMGFESEQVQALANLLAMSELHMSFYDDFGTASVRAALSLDGVELLTADMLVYEDGSVQLMTNLTGKLVLTLPAGTFVNGRLDLSVLEEETEERIYDLSIPEDAEAFHALPAMERIKITGSDMISLLIGHLLGWVSYVQMDTDGNLYVFDDTYLEATETRDPVSQRMLGTIEAHRFNTLFHDIAMTICDKEGEFQLAVADLLAQNGVTRYQVRQFVDALLTEETIDPMIDWVQPSGSIPDDGALCTYDDISYFFKKLVKCTNRLWENSTENVLHMNVSYDDFGGMVGFDADMPQFTTLLPYEGDFTYSIKTDDNWQRMHTSHGELQVYNDNRVIGDLKMQFGQDVGGVNKSSVKGQADVVNQKDGTSFGIGVDAAVDFEVTVGADGAESEEFEGRVVLNARENGADAPLTAFTFSGMSTVDAVGFGCSATGALSIADTATLIADMTFEQVEYEEIAFAGGEAISLAELDDAALEKITGEVTAQAAKLGMSLMFKGDVLSNLMTLMGE